MIYVAAISLLAWIRGIDWLEIFFWEEACIILLLLHTRERDLFGGKHGNEVFF